MRRPWFSQCVRWKKTATTLRRQYIRDAGGNPIGVILPIEEYNRVASLLEERFVDDPDKERLEQIEYAVRDPLFLADLRETMAAYEVADAQWWEPGE